MKHWVNCKKVTVDSVVMPRVNRPYVFSRVVLKRKPVIDTQWESCHKTFVCSKNWAQNHNKLSHTTLIKEDCSTIMENNSAPLSLGGAILNAISIRGIDYFKNETSSMDHQCMRSIAIGIFLRNGIISSFKMPPPNENTRMEQNSFPW